MVVHKGGSFLQLCERSRIRGEEADQVWGSGPPPTVSYDVFTIGDHLGAIHILRHTQGGALLTDMCNRFEHQKLNQTAATQSSGWVFGVQIDLRQTEALMNTNDIILIQHHRHVIHHHDRFTGKWSNLDRASFIIFQSIDHDEWFIIMINSLYSDPTCTMYKLDDFPVNRSWWWMTWRWCWISMMS